MNSAGQCAVFACTTAKKAEVKAIAVQGLARNERNIVWNMPRKSISSKAGTIATVVIMIKILVGSCRCVFKNSSSWWGCIWKSCPQINWPKKVVITMASTIRGQIPSRFTKAPEKSLRTVLGLSPKPLRRRAKLILAR